MPLVLLMAALCSGLTTAVVWMSLGGTALMAFAVYILSGHIVMASMIGYAALRSFR